MTELGHKTYLQAQLSEVDLHLNAAVQVEAWSPGPVMPLRVAVVESDRGPMLEYGYNPDGQVRRIADNKGCLSDFLRLHDAGEDPQRVADFARKYGALAMECEHGMTLRQPRCMDCYNRLIQFGPLFAEAPRGDSERWSVLLLVCRGEYQFALDALRTFNRRLSPDSQHADDRLRDILGQLQPSCESTAAYVEEARQLSDMLTELVRLRKAPPDEKTRARGLELMKNANAWSQRAVQLQTEFIWHVRESRMHYVSYGMGLTGILGAQFAATISSSSTFVCHSCGKLFEHTPGNGRAPKANQNTHCPECRKGDYRIMRNTRRREKRATDKAARDKPPES